MTLFFALAQAMAKVLFSKLLLSWVAPGSSYLLSVHLKRSNAISYAFLLSFFKALTILQILQILKYGNRPSWGLDVGCERQLFLHHTTDNTANPLLDTLFILPQVLTRQCLSYFDSENACRLAVLFIRKSLPELPIKWFLKNVVLEDRLEASSSRRTWNVSNFRSCLWCDEVVTSST